MAYLFRLSRIGNALPVEHLYPEANGAEKPVNVRRAGAQCFQSFDEMVQHVGESAMVPGADRVLMIEVHGDAEDLPHDESGWRIIREADVVSVRTLPAEVETLYSFDDDDQMWEAAEPVMVGYVQTV
ncbi:hypothetical protein [Xanthobacter sediminis]